MAITIEQLLAQAQVVLESRGKRVVEVTEAEAAEAKAQEERAQADEANVTEDEAIAALKQMANDYQKEVDDTPDPTPEPA